MLHVNSPSPLHPAVGHLSDQHKHQRMGSEEPPRASLEFAESSVLEAIAPAASNVDIEEAFNSWDGTVEDEGASILPFVKQRHVLLFGACLLTASYKQASYSYLG